MDAVISIGGQSFVDGLVRILGPELQALRQPIPIALPELENALLTIRSIRSRLPGLPSGSGNITFDLEIDLTAEVPLVANVGNLTGVVAAPLPSIVPVAMNFTEGAPITAQVSLSPLINGSAVGGSDVQIDKFGGFGLEFSFSQPNVNVDPFPTPAATLTMDLQNGFNTVTNQLFQGVTPVPAQPGTTLSTVIANLIAAIPAAATTTLTDAFANLRARTGRLVFPPAPAGSPCGISLRAVDGRARLGAGSSGPVLQVGFDRTPTPPGTPFPSPPFGGPPPGSPGPDTMVTLTNEFVRDLLACMIEKFPNLSLPTPVTFTPPIPTTPVPPNSPVTPWTATWAGVTLTVGSLAFTGTMTLSIAGTPGSTPPVSKTISLGFALAAAVGASPVIPLIGVPLFPGPALTVALTFTLPIIFDLNGLASITALRLAAPATTTFAFALGGGFITALIFLGVLVAAGILVGPFSVTWPGLIAIGLLIVAVPLIVTSIVGGLLGNGINQVLGGLHHVLESAPGIPPGIFEAFGEFVPLTVFVDDLVSLGNLRTPTSPWAVLPLRFEE